MTVSSGSRPAKRVVVALAAPDQPADHGLAALGLIMTLVGSVMAPLGAAALLMTAYSAARLDVGGSSGGQMMWAVVLGLAGVGRSLIHRRSGIRLWRSEPTDPPVLSGITLYAAAALMHTVLWLAFLAGHDTGGTGLIGTALTLMAWPVALVVIVRLPRYQALGPRPPTGEDNGFEGLAVLMAILGAAGLLFSIMLVILGLATRDGQANWMSNVALMSGLALSIRAGIQLSAGIKGARGGALTAVNDFARYGNLGTTLGGVVGGMITLWMLVETLDLVVLATGIAILLALLAWPTTVRRFVAWRHLADINEPVARRRSPDAGVTALGWFLLGLAVVALAQGVAGELGGDTQTILPESIMNLSGLSLGGDQAWWNIPLALAQMWAALELLAVSERHRVVATLWAVAALAVMALDLDDGYALMTRGSLLARATGWCAILLAATPAAATLLLVHRRVVPQAVARIAARERTGAPPG